MQSRLIGSVLAGVLLFTGSLSVQAEGDSAKGKRVWNKCRACHTMKPGRNMTGPSLAGILGSKAAQNEKYRYSKAMMESGLVWDDATLTNYLAAPRKVVKGTKMTFPGIKKPQDSANLIAYMRENGG